MSDESYRVVKSKDGGSVAIILPAGDLSELWRAYFTVLEVAMDAPIRSMPRGQLLRSLGESLKRAAQ